MIRMFFTYMLPLALPTLIYVLWVWNARRKHDPDGEDTLPGLRRAAESISGSAVPEASCTE